LLPYEPFVGIWVKAEPRHIQTFIDNWEKFNVPQAFCVYDLPPMLPYGGLIFLHAIGQSRIMAWAKYVGIFSKRRPKSLVTNKPDLEICRHNTGGW
jgi:hypothetical protein